AEYLHDDMLSAGDIARAERLWRSGGRNTEAARADRWGLRPLTTARGAMALLAIDRPGRARTPPGDEKNQAPPLGQAAVAVERALLATSLEDARVRAKAEELRDAVISAISHDLQTPLASIIGAVTALRGFGPIYDEAARSELIATIHEEAVRLDHFI